MQDKKKTSELISELNLGHHGHVHNVGEDIREGLSVLQNIWVNA